MCCLIEEGLCARRRPLSPSMNEAEHCTAEGLLQEFSGGYDPPRRPALNYEGSASELEAVAAEFFWSSSPVDLDTEQQTLRIHQPRKQCVHVKSSTCAALEPHESCLRQAWKLIHRSCATYSVLFLVTLLALVPLTGGAITRYVETWKARATALIILWNVNFIAVNGIPAGPCLFTGTLSLAALGVITTTDTIAGLSNPVVLIVGSLNIIAKALENAGALERLVLPLLGNPRSARMAQVRLMLTVSVCCGFMNHMPVVAMMIPVVKGWSAKIGVPEAQLMMPLTYASVLGGMTTLLGSGSTLVASQWAVRQGLAPLGLFATTPVATALCAMGIVYMVCVAQRMLPAGASVGREESDLEGARFKAFRYPATFTVLGPGAFNMALGRTPRELGLLALPGASLTAESRLVAAQPLEDGDRLHFIASAAGFVSIRRVLGLAPPGWDSIRRELGIRRSHRRHYEAVLAPSSPLVGAALDLRRFARAFRAVPLSVCRQGQAALELGQDFEGFVLKAQDILLLEGFQPGPPAGGCDFLLVGEVPDSAPPRCFRSTDVWRQRFCLLGLSAVLVGTAAGCNLALAAALLAVCLLLVKALTLAEAYRFINGPILLTIAAAFGLGTAIENSGLAAELAAVALEVFQPLGCIGTVLGTYICGALLGQFLGNVSSTLILLPMMPPLAAATGLPLGMFMLVVLFSVNASFSTPLSSLTNLMVLPHGGYTFSDYFAVGMPLMMLHMLGTCSLLWAQWS